MPAARDNGRGCSGQSALASGPISHSRYRLAPEPTDALPGTVEKILVMQRRAEMGYAVFHPGDAGADIG